MENKQKVVQHSKLKKEHNYYSEQWLVKYNFLQDNGFWKTREVLYCTEDKGMGEEVEKQWQKDFGGKHTSIISIHYL